MCTRSTKLKYVRCVLGCVLHHQMNRKSSQQRASLPLQQKSDYNSKINCRKRFQSKLNCGLQSLFLQVALVHHCPRTQNGQEKNFCALLQNCVRRCNQILGVHRSAQEIQTQLCSVPKRSSRWIVVYSCCRSLLWSAKCDMSYTYWVLETTYLWTCKTKCKSKIPYFPGEMLVAPVWHIGTMETHEMRF